MIPVALTIAGSDSGGGAGVQADIKTMQAHGVFATSVLTAITAQNTHQVTAAFDLPTDLVQAQIRAVLDDFPVGAIKTGMLSSAEIIAAVAEMLRPRLTMPLVVDPVMISKSGFDLLRPDAIETLIRALFPLATVVTPNTHEAARLTGKPVSTLPEMHEAARQIFDMGPRAVLLKGGHLEDSPQAVDILFDGTDFFSFAADRIDTPHTHGTGCTYASAIAANLARGFDLVTAIERAKRYVSAAILHGLPLGHGHGPTHHFYFLENHSFFPLDDTPSP